MNMRSLLILVIVILAWACGRQNSNTNSGRVLKIDYNQSDTLKDGQWIQIDRWRFPHIRNRLKAKHISFSLPTTSLVFDTLKNDREVRTTISPYVMGLHLARYLDVINQDSLTGSQPKYLIPNFSLISVKGALHLLKSDSSIITIETSPDYPADITVIE